MLQELVTMEMFFYIRLVIAIYNIVIFLRTTFKSLKHSHLESRSGKLVIFNLKREISDGAHAIGVGPLICFKGIPVPPGQ